MAEKDITPSSPSVNILGSVRQTITADHHLDPKQSAIEQARWPRIWASPTTSKKESQHAEETRPTDDAAD